MPFTPQAFTVTNTGQPIVVELTVASLPFTPSNLVIEISAAKTVTIAPVMI